MTTDPPIVLDQVTHRFDDGPPAVDGLSFHVPAGSLCGFVGRNGAGKSTTLRLLAGLILRGFSTPAWIYPDEFLNRRRLPVQVPSLDADTGNVRQPKTITAILLHFLSQSVCVK